MLKSSGSGGKGINCDGALTIDGGTLAVVTTGSKYIYNTAADLTSSPNGVKADGDILINGGTIDVRAVGVSDGTEGVESNRPSPSTGERLRFMLTTVRGTPRMPSSSMMDMYGAIPPPMTVSTRTEHSQSMAAW